MIKQISLAAGLLFCLFFTNKVTAQTVTADVKTKIYCSHCQQCETCGQRFDTELYKLKGLKTFTMKGDVITVTYDKKKLTIEKIRECISNCGYDADDVKATEAGLNSLDGCCRKQE